MSRFSFWLLYLVGMFFVVLNFWYSPALIFPFAVIYVLALIAIAILLTEDKEPDEQKFVNCGKPECKNCTSCKGCRH